MRASQLPFSTAVLVFLLTSLPSLAAAQLSGGPDGFGYVFSEGSPDYVSLSQPGDSTVSGEYTLPWGFEFYGQTYNSVWVHEDGVLSFAAATPSASNSCLPALASGVDIAAWWDDLTGDVLVRDETSPNRVILSWQNAHHATNSGGNGIDFQVHLYDTGVIELHYNDVTFGGGAPNAGSSATVGIQDATGSGQGDLEAVCNQNLLSNGLALVFEDCPDDDNDGSCNADDCEDNDANSYPGAPELCDGVDNDCDGNLGPLETDDDGDGFDECNDNDCDDSNSAVYPGAPEVCDGLDTDCDPSTSETVDQDGDSVSLCAGDCDDDDADNYPGNTEVCDDADNDCDGAPSSFLELDADGDGATCDDCDGNDGTVFPGAIELCDEIDNDCVGGVPATEVDDDGDGYRECEGDCDDGDAAVKPGAVEQCNGLDDDCDGIASGEILIDEFLASGGTSLFRNFVGHRFVSDATSHFIRLSAEVSIPAGGTAEFGVYRQGGGTTWTRVHHEVLSFPTGTSNFEWVESAPMPLALAPGEQMVAGIYSPNVESLIRRDLTGRLYYPVEVGFGQILTAVYDNNVDGAEPTLSMPAFDDGLRLRYVFGDEDDWDGDGYSGCEECDDSEASVSPDAEELCDGLDNDCSGAPDADPDGEVDGDGDGSLSCEDCDDTDGEIHVGAEEVCDGLDNDCDPETDEGNDLDQDGYSICTGDCDDGDAEIGPDQPEVCDGLDNDCDPETVEDADADGDGLTPCEGDCDDRNAAVSPDAPELVCSGEDEDCDGALDPGEVDADGDGVRACDGDCNDSSAAAAPGLTETSEAACTDGLDNDCDLLVDIDEADCAYVYAEEEGGCACASEVAGRRGGSLFALLLLLLAPRRRRDGAAARRSWD